MLSVVVSAPADGPKPGKNDDPKGKTAGNGDKPTRKRGKNAKAGDGKKKTDKPDRPSNIARLKLDRPEQQAVADAAIELMTGRPEEYVALCGKARELADVLGDHGDDVCLRMRRHHRWGDNAFKGHLKRNHCLNRIFHFYGVVNRTRHLRNNDIIVTFLFQRTYQKLAQSGR